VGEATLGFGEPLRLVDQRPDRTSPGARKGEVLARIKVEVEREDAGVRGQRQAREPLEPLAGDVVSLEAWPRFDLLAHSPLG
jgi:hypothetical protein